MTIETDTKIGIGITTRNRPEMLNACLANLARYHTVEHTYVIVDDASDVCDNTPIVNDFRNKVKAEVIYRKSPKRLGITKAKNASLSPIQDHNIIILLDDDAWPMRAGWSTYWADACSAHDIHHSTYQRYLTPAPLNGEPFTDATFSVGKKLTSGDFTMNEWSNCMGMALLFTNHAIKTVGGYDADRALAYYGYEHANMSRRCNMAGLTKGLTYACPEDIHEWIYSIDISYNWHNEICEFDMPPLDAVETSVTPEEAQDYRRNVGLLSLNQSNIFVPLVDPLENNCGADVIIPTKCNDENLFELISTLRKDNSVHDIIIIADGEETFNRLRPIVDPSVTLTSVDLSIGLHRMWNLGMDMVQENNRHVAIINDDVTLDEGAVGVVAEMLSLDSSLGLISPSDNQHYTEYMNITTAFAGYCMILSADLAREWRFDERMKWWYGDNDIMTWVANVAKRINAQTGKTHALGNKSHTIHTNPPKNFHQEIANDAMIFKKKWE